MAVLKYSAIVDEIKGSINGQTFQGGPAGPIIRSKPVPLATKSSQVSASQQYNRGVFSFFAKRWSSLTPAQRASWSTLVGIWTFTDKFGNTYNGSPFQIYRALNMNLVTNGLSGVSTAPSYATGTPITIDNIDFDLSGGLDVTIVDPGTYDSTFQIWCSPPVKASTSFVNTFAVKLANETPSGADTFDVKDAYIGAFGNVPPLGSFVWVKTQQFVPSYPRYEYAQYNLVEVVST